MRQCARAGYPVRAVVMPIVPVLDWQAAYGGFLSALLESVPLSRITLGSICSYPQALRLMELKLGKHNAVSSLLRKGDRPDFRFGDRPGFRAAKMGLSPSVPSAKPADGRLRFSRSTREEVYRYLIACIRRYRPNLEIGLCLEDEAMFASLGLQESLGRCNCVL
jgi:hypothetical protein